MNRMNAKTTLLLLILFAGSMAIFPQKSDLTAPLPVDSGFIIGNLNNGLTYYIRESNEPKGRAEFFIVHNVGSLQEEDNQRGLAHFLEHMAFNGTKNFPDKTLLNYFGSIGVKFGANINAYTSMDRTVYNISDVPVARGVVIDSALLALHDWSHYITCGMEEIDKERGVVREEWRRGDVALTRMMKAISRFQQTGSRFAERDVIGLMSVIDVFERQTLIDYYHKWYRPDLQAVIVVGDIDKEEIKNRIINTFSSIPTVRDASPKEQYSIPGNKEPIIGYFTDPETSAVSVRLTIKIPPLTDEKKQTELYLYDDLTDKLFIELIKERFRIASLDPGSFFRMVIPVFGTINYASKIFTSTAIPVEDEKTFEALEDILIEIERAKQYGFEEKELENAKKIVAVEMEKQYQRFKKRKNVDYVNEAVEHYTRSMPLMNFDTRNSIQKEMLDKIVIEDINSKLAKILDHENRVIIFAIPEKLKHSLPLESEVLSLIKDIQNREMEQFIPAEAKELPSIQIATPGKIIQSRDVTSQDYGITYEVPLDSTTEWILENGVKVVWKEEFGKDPNVRLYAFRQGGYAYPNDMEDLKLLNQFLRNISVSNMNQNELSIWSQKNELSLRAFINNRNEGFWGSFKPESSDKFFTLLHRYFTDVAAEQKEVDNFKKRMMKNVQYRSSQSIYADSVNSLMYDNNLLLKNVTEPAILSVTSQKMNELYRSHFYAPDGFTFLFVGPMSTKEARPLIEKYVATLSGGGGKPELTFRESCLKTGEIEFQYNATDLLSSKAAVTRIYHEKCDYTAKSNLLARFVAYVLSNRYLKSIREDKGGTYHVGVKEEMSRYPVQTLAFHIKFDTNPVLVDELLEIVQEEIDSLVVDGPTENEINEIKLYLRKRYSDRKKEMTWFNIITDALQDNPDFASEETDLLEEINPQSIQEFAKSIFGSNNRMTFVFKPS